MSGKAKFGIAFALMFVALATAPAVQCLAYLAQNTQTTHSCCPQQKPQSAVPPSCCIHSPAITSHAVNVPVPIVTMSVFTAVAPITASLIGEAAVVGYIDTSPPDCSSILRI